MEHRRPHPARRNALAGETSPYLLQHAHNPVDWYPWGAEALELARRSGRPILLSVGYSACHWCHVMAHESFEDGETAALMNEYFVNIKVDREERPDIDKIYQTAQYLLTHRHGGWPLTMFLTPEDQTPFFGGTYFPREPRYGLPGFTDLLRHIATAYRERGQEIREQNAAVIEALNQLQQLPAEGPQPPDSAPLHAARQEIAQSFDATLGGFGAAPKFPHPSTIERLLRHYAATALAGRADAEALQMATFTLAQMALGGIYDQLGGGFARYSVDDRWMIPHFEKMLYDNGPLLALYSEAFQINGDLLSRKTAVEIAGWAMRDMQSPAGGYYSSLDADSGGHEGRFYVWTREEAAGVLDEEEYLPFARHFGLDHGPNFEGRWHLHVHLRIEQIAQEFGISEEVARERIDDARRKLLAVRERRTRPGRDEKVLTSWNALMIRGMATAGRVFGRADFIESGERALDFIRAQLWRDGRLLATYKDGRAHLNAYLDDHAFLIDALLALLSVRWREADLRFAIDLAEALLARFEDRDRGGFYFTSHDHERLLQRTRTLADEALPSGNGIAAGALGRLGHLLGERRYVDAAERTLKAAWPAIDSQPSAHLSLLAALEETLKPPELIVIRGGGEELARWRQRATAHYAPRRLALAIPGDADDLPGLLAARAGATGTTAYVCEGRQCGAPVDNYGEFDRRLSRSEVARDSTMNKTP